MPTGATVVANSSVTACDVLQTISWPASGPWARKVQWGDCPYAPCCTWERYRSTHHRYSIVLHLAYEPSNVMRPVHSQAMPWRSVVAFEGLTVESNAVQSNASREIPIKNV
jgi:hypothetical protein